MANEDDRSVSQNRNKILGLIAQTLIDMSGTTTTGVSTVSGLPTTVVQGARRMVTDATATTFHSVVAGGGANIVPVFFDGTDWRVG